MIDAGEGARPQTHEHLAILRLLGIDRGVVAVTKADAVDAETLELARRRRREELVPEAQVVAVSAKTGAGLDELRAALAAAAVDAERPAWPTRLYVDRVFTLHGIGTVATGTLWSGRSAKETSCASSPAAAPCACGACRCTTRRSRRAEAGQRVASRCPASNGTSCGAATRSSQRARSRSSYRARRRA